MLRYCASTPPTYDLEWSPPDASSHNRSAAAAAAAPWLLLHPRVQGGTVRVGRMAAYAAPRFRLRAYQGTSHSSRDTHDESAVGESPPLLPGRGAAALHAPPTAVATSSASVFVEWDGAAHSRNPTCYSMGCTTACWRLQHHAQAATLRTQAATMRIQALPIAADPTRGGRCSTRDRPSARLALRPPC